jgi:hypothetical protein
MWIGREFRNLILVAAGTLSVPSVIYLATTPRLQCFRMRSPTCKRRRRTPGPRKHNSESEFDLERLKSRYGLWCGARLPDEP